MRARLTWGVQRACGPHVPDSLSQAGCLLPTLGEAAPQDHLPASVPPHHNPSRTLGPLRRSFPRATSWSHQFAVRYPAAAPEAHSKKKINAPYLLAERKAGESKSPQWARKGEAVEYLFLGRIAYTCRVAYTISLFVGMQRRIRSSRPHLLCWQGWPRADYVLCPSLHPVR